MNYGNVKSINNDFVVTVFLFLFIVTFSSELHFFIRIVLSNNNKQSFNLEELNCDEVGCGEE